MGGVVVDLQVRPDPGRDVLLQVGGHLAAGLGVGAQGIGVRAAQEVGDDDYRGQAVVVGRVGVHRVLQVPQLEPVRRASRLPGEQDEDRQGRAL